MLWDSPSEQDPESGPKVQKELVKQSGFGERTLQRAARKLSVKRERAGERSRGSGAFDNLNPAHTQQYRDLSPMRKAVAYAVHS